MSTGRVKLETCCQAVVDYYLSIPGTKETLDRPGHALYCSTCYSRIVYRNRVWYVEKEGSS